MNRRSGDLEVSLEIGFGRGFAVDLRVVVNEGQVLALFGRKLRCNGRIEFRRALYRNLKVVVAETSILRALRM